MPPLGQNPVLRPSRPTPDTNALSRGCQTAESTAGGRSPTTSTTPLVVVRSGTCGSDAQFAVTKHNSPAHEVYRCIASNPTSSGRRACPGSRHGSSCSTAAASKRPTNSSAIPGEAVVSGPRSGACPESFELASLGRAESDTGIQARSTPTAVSSEPEWPTRDSRSGGSARRHKGSLGSFSACVDGRNTLRLGHQRGTTCHLGIARPSRREPCRVSSSPRTDGHCIRGSWRTQRARLRLRLRGSAFLSWSGSSYSRPNMTKPKRLAHQVGVSRRPRLADRRPRLRSGAGAGWSRADAMRAPAFATGCRSRYGPITRMEAKPM